MNQHECQESEIRIEKNSYSSAQARAKGFCLSKQAHDKSQAASTRSFQASTARFGKVHA